MEQTTEQKPKQRGYCPGTVLFKKGQSGNPAGRKPKPPEVRALERITREQASVALERLVGPALRVLERAMKSGDEALALRAAVDVVDRTQGKAIQRIDANVTNNEVRRPTPELLEMAARRILALRAAEATDAEVRE